MWIVIAPEHDPSVPWVVKGLENRGLTSIEWLSPQQLAFAENWNHRLGKEGTFIRIRLKDHREIDSQEVAGVLNRLEQVPEAHSIPASSTDQQYAFQEMAAFYLSWLNSFDGPILNPPCPNGLSGPRLASLEWFCLAGRAQLRCPTLTQSSRDPYGSIWQSKAGIQQEYLTLPRENVFVVGELVLADRCGPPVPEPLITASLHLSQLANTPLLQIEFGRCEDGEWVFLSANPLPDLRVGGEPLLDALAKTLQSRMVTAPGVTV